MYLNRVIFHAVTVSECITLKSVYHSIYTIMSDVEQKKIQQNKIIAISKF